MISTKNSHRTTAAPASPNQPPANESSDSLATIELRPGTLLLRGDYKIGGPSSVHGELNQAMSAVIAKILERIEKLDLPVNLGLTQDQYKAFEFKVRMCLEEQISNHIKHGNGCELQKQVLVDIDFHPADDGKFSHLVITSKDEGPGYDVSAVPDCTSEENLSKATGRGHLLMRAYANRIEHFDNSRVCRMTIFPLPTN